MSEGGTTDTVTSAYAQAEALIDLGRPQEAIAPLSRVIAEDPDAAAPRCLMAVALLQSGDPHAAANAAREGVARDPEDAWGHWLHAHAMRELGKLKEARASALQAISLWPESSASHAVLSMIELDAGRAGDARRAAERAAQLEPENPGNHELVGAVALEQKQYKVAEMAFRRALELDPEQASAHNDLGIALLEQKRRDEAMRSFETAARIDPHDDTARHNLVGSGTDFLRKGGWLLGLAGWVAIRALADGDQTVLPIAALGAAVLAVVALCYLVAQRRREPGFSGATRALLDDARARVRQAPWRWRPSDSYRPVAFSILSGLIAQFAVVLIAVPTVLVGAGLVLLAIKVPVLAPIVLPLAVIGYIGLWIYALRRRSRKRRY